MNSNQNTMNNIPISDSNTVAGSQLTNTNQEIPKDNQKIQLPQQEKIKSKKEKPIVTILLLVVIAGLLFFISYLYSNHQNEIAKLKYECTPISTSGIEKELNLDSTIVQDLYSKVKTNIREDLANSELNDEMKLYLAYRQMPTEKIYESNCNLYNNAKMEPYTCKETLEFTPLAFKEENLTLEVKKLFGESTNLQHDDIQLGISCIGGYQYIAERGEYVQGKCPQIENVVFRADKKLIKATSQESTITLYESVKYSATSGKELPEKLVSGTYKYTFRLDMNYNYIYVNKELEI